MPPLDAARRAALLDERHSLKNAQAGWIGVAGVFTAAAGFVAAPLLFAPLAAGSVIIAVLKRKENAVDRILEDPPRFDYEVRTQAHPRRYRTGMLGDDDLAVATDHVAVAALRVVAYLEAAVRADERGQGAGEHGREELEQAQLARAARAMERAQIAEVVLSSRLDELGIALAAFASDDRLSSLPTPSIGGRVNLPTRGLRALSRTGLVVSDLDLSVEIDERDEAGRSFGGPLPTRPFFDVALDVAQRTRELAAAGAQVARPVIDLPTSPRYADALAARRRGELDVASELLRAEAEVGSGDAMFELGVLARERGDLTDAKRWMTAAAALRRPYGTAIELEKLDLGEFGLIRDLGDFTLPQPPPRLDSGESDE